MVTLFCLPQETSRSFERTGNSHHRRRGAVDRKRSGARIPNPIAKTKVVLFVSLSVAGAISVSNPKAPRFLARNSNSVWPHRRLSYVDVESTSMSVEDEAKISDGCSTLASPSFGKFGKTEDPFNSACSHKLFWGQKHLDIVTMNTIKYSIVFGRYSNYV